MTHFDEAKARKAGVRTEVIEMARTWVAMNKFADNKPLTDAEWSDLSRLTLLDRNRLEFGPDNVRLAQSETERANNEQFYRSL
jgi:hypothetical protein